MDKFEAHFPQRISGVGEAKGDKANSRQFYCKYSVRATVLATVLPFQTSMHWDVVSIKSDLPHNTVTLSMRSYRDT